jgi:putative redox protein
MILHSPIDNVVGVENAAEIYEAAKHPKSFVSLDAADHLLSSRQDSAYAASMIATFASRYVDDESGGLPAPAATAQTVVAETTQGPFLNHVVVGRHSLLADEPASVGGFDAGPGPYDFLSAALGTCTSMTVRMYADRKGVPLDRVKVEVAHGKVHADDCVECAENDRLIDRRGMIDRFERVLTLEGDLDDEQRSRLLGIADRCPVHRTLESSSAIVTVLASD